MVVDAKDPTLTLSPNIRTSDHFLIDCSKLAQWEVVFEHAQRMGMMIHLKLQIPSSPGADPTTYEIERKFIYREFVARFAHHLAIQWNIGIEGSASLDYYQGDAKYIKSLDPY
jgi:hypothetical protein